MKKKTCMPKLASIDGESTVLSLLLIAVLFSLLAHEFGFHPTIGAYMAGLIIRYEYFDFHQEQQIDYFHRTKTILDSIAFSWIGPIFFVMLGSKLIFEGNLFLSILPQALFLFIALLIGQILSAALAAHYTGKFAWPDSWLIGFGMLGRAELAFVVLEIAYVQYNILSQDAFYTLMITAFLLNISVPLSIRWWKIKFNVTESFN